VAKQIGERNEARKQLETENARQHNDPSDTVMTRFSVRHKLKDKFSREIKAF